MESFLQFVADGKLDLKPLITHRFPIEEASRAYELISGATPERTLAVLFTYSEQTPISRRLELTSVPRTTTAAGTGSITVGLLGPGSFAMSTLLPAMQQVTGIDLIGVSAATGAHSRHAADKFRFRYCTTDVNEIVADASINTVVIATRHHLHARQVLAALAAGKHVFCEKPLCLTENELADIVQALPPSHPAQPALMVGFNRRFAPMARQMKAFLDIHEPLVMHYRVNAGALPADHWINDPEIGGGRIVGEVCHFVDFLSFLSGSHPIEVQARSLPSGSRRDDESVMISLRFANGSEGSIHYLINGDRSFSKERVEVFGGGAVAVLEDFRSLEMTRFGRRSTATARWRQDKGHHGEWQAFADALRAGNPAPIPFSSIISATLTTLGIVKARATGQPVTIDTEDFLRRVSLGKDPEN